MNQPIRNILILGATSAIAEASARLWAAEGASFMLVGRRAQKLQAIADDLEIRGAKVCHTHALDLTDRGGYPSLFAITETVLGKIDLILIAHGNLPEQKTCEESTDAALAAIEINGISVVALLTQAANRLEAQGYGTLAVIGSVAGDRGRQSNYIYGAAKSLVDCFCQGLRNRLAKKGVHVLTLKPGMTDTPMTAAMPKGGPLWSSPQQVAAGIKRAVEKRKDVAYLPGFWRLIMFIICLIPERIFKRLSM